MRFEHVTCAQRHDAITLLELFLAFAGYELKNKSPSHPGPGQMLFEMCSPSMVSRGPVDFEPCSRRP
jgi:hypothetical protein